MNDTKKTALMANDISAMQDTYLAATSDEALMCILMGGKAVQHG